MPLASILSRSLKAREEQSDVEPYSDELDASSPSLLDTGEGEGSVRTDDSDDDGLEDGRTGHDDNEGSDIEDGTSGSDEGQEVVKKQLSTVSFGALSMAQNSLGKRKRPSNSTGEEKLEALRERLRELKRSKTSGGKESSRSNDMAPGKASHEPNLSSRTSKHAPTSQPSSKAVSRKRTIFAAPKPPSLGDPRFSSLVGPADDNRLKQNYSFLAEYRDAEINELQATLREVRSKKRKLSEEDKQIMERKLLRLESKRKAEQEKERKAKVLREHRKKEKAAVKEGKKPFYIKKSEQKKLALVDKYSNMKAKERDHAIERRTKKEAAKEKKKMPSTRRTLNA